MDFGKDFLVNKGEIDEELKSLNTSGSLSPSKTLFYNEDFNDLNLTTLKTIETDPEIKLYYLPYIYEPPANDPDEPSGDDLLLFLLNPLHLVYQLN